MTEYLTPVQYSRRFTEKGGYCFPSPLRESQNPPVVLLASVGGLDTIILTLKFDSGGKQLGV